MNKARFVACAALVVSGPAWSSDPVYLQCHWEYKTVSTDAAITLNEEAGTAIVVEHDRTHRVSALFSPQEVVIDLGLAYERYTINRVNLDFKADWKAYFGPVSAPGKCTLVETPPRKF